jgi:hypothetical protein
MGSIVGIAALGLLWWAFLQPKDQKTGMLKEKAEIEKAQTNTNTLYAFFDAILPDIFTVKPWYMRLWNKMTYEHDWLVLFMPSSPDRDPAAIRWVLAMGRLITFLFIDTLLASLFFNDDGTCQSYATQADCELPRQLDQIDTLCAWDSDQFQCSFNQTDPTFYGVLIQAFVISTCAIPFNALFRYMINMLKGFSMEVFSHMKLNGYTVDELNCDAELMLFETTKSKVFLASRLEKMIAAMDRVSALEEAALLTADTSTPWHTKEDAKKVDYFLFGDRAGDSLAAAKLVHTYTEVELVRSLVQVRQREKDLVHTLESLDSAQQKEVYLLQSFLVESLPGYRRDIIYTFFFGDFEQHNQSRHALFKVAIYIGVPLYIFALVFYVFLFGVGIGVDATKLWLLGSLFAFLQDVFILSTLKIWLKFIVVSTAGSKLIREYHHLLKVRTEVLLRRYVGLMKHSNALIHHFNPACRAARSFPDLPIARVLISLNDFDLPIIYTEIRKTKSNVDYIATAAAATLAVFSFALTLLPEALQDATGEVAMTSGFNGGLVVLTVISDVSIALPIILVLAFVSIIVAREMYQYRQWKKVVPDSGGRALVYEDAELDEAVTKSAKVKLEPQNKYADFGDIVGQEVVTKPVPENHVDGYELEHEVVQLFQHVSEKSAHSDSPVALIDPPTSAKQKVMKEMPFTDLMDDGRTEAEAAPVFTSSKVKIHNISIPLRKRKYAVDEDHDQLKESIVESEKVKESVVGGAGAGTPPRTVKINAVAIPLKNLDPVLMSRLDQQDHGHELL